MTDDGRHGTPLPAHEQQAIRALAEARGVRQASAALEVAPGTLARAVAGLRVTRAIATHLRAKLATLNPAAPEATP